MSKHTPGPWRFLEADDHNRDDNSCRPLTICGLADDDLANVYSSDDSTVSISREEAVANARLIAAAPDLLEALKAYMHAMEGFAEAVRAVTGTAYPWEAQDIERAKALAALSKAKGK
jgi:hypothetical protein